MTIAELLAHTALAIWLLGSVCRGVMDNLIAMHSWSRSAANLVSAGVVTSKVFLASQILLIIGILREAWYQVLVPKRFGDFEVAGPSMAATTCIVYVPGTWSKASRHRPKIVDFLSESYPGRAVLVFRWKSRNNAHGRDAAANKLALHLSTHPVLAKAKKIYLIGHSHGGSVCAAAASIAQDHRCKVVAVGTPFVEFYGRDTINWGGFSALFGVLIWPLLLASLSIGMGIQSISLVTLPLVALSMAGLVLMALLIRAFIKITVILESGPIKSYAACINIIANEDALIRTMERVSTFFQQRALLLEDLTSNNAGYPHTPKVKPAIWISVLVWMSGFIFTAYFLLSASWLVVIPICAVGGWFYAFPSRRPWQIGYFVPTFLLMANPVAVLMMLSTSVTFGLNVLQVALGRARITTRPGQARCISLSLVDIKLVERTVNAHSAMLDSALVRAEILRHLT